MTDNDRPDLHDLIPPWLARHAWWIAWAYVPFLLALAVWTAVIGEWLSAGMLVVLAGGASWLGRLWRP